MIIDLVYCITYIFTKHLIVDDKLTFITNTLFRFTQENKSSIVLVWVKLLNYLSKNLLVLDLVI